jgi:hypothetical protein
MEREELAVGRVYYVLGLTTKGPWLSQRTVAFPVLGADDDERIPSGAKALLVFADHKRAFERLAREMPERASSFTLETGQEIGAFIISHMTRHEVKATAKTLAADYIVVEQAEGRFTVADA